MAIAWLAPTCDEQSAATACPTWLRAATTGVKVPVGAREIAATAAEPAWLTRVEDPRAADIGPRNPTTVCSRHARHTMALSAPEVDVPRIMVGVVVTRRRRRKGGEQSVCAIDTRRA